MNLKLGILIVTALLVGVSCDTFRWPPFEEQLTTMFNENVEIVLAIEQEMIRDGRTVAGSGLKDGRYRSRVGEPEFTPEQLDRYAALFGDLDFYATFFRDQDRTYIQLMKQSVRSREYYVTYANSEVPESVPSCDLADRKTRCGDCIVPLQDNWHIAYRWFPQEDIEGVESCFNDR